MRIPFFEEVQTLRNNPWVWVFAMIPLLVAMIPIGAGLHLQLVEGKPWGDKPMSDEGLITFAVFMAIIFLSFIALICTSTLRIRIDNEGVRYKKFPSRKWATIRFEEIARFEPKKLGLFQTPGSQKFPARNLQHKVIKILSRRAVVFFLKNGNTITLGTANPEGIFFSLKRVLAQNER